jgi:MYXO-CTERM domain-containing protein
MKRVLTVCTIVIWTAVVGAHASVSVNLPFSKDSYINSGQPDRNFGGTVQFQSQGTTRRGLFAFDINTTLVPGPVEAVDILLTATNTGGTTSSTHTLYALTRAWVEGQDTTGPNPAILGVTWNNANAAGPVPWTTPGGDYDPTPLGSITFPGSMTVGTQYTLSLNPTGVALVEQWRTGAAANHGFILMNTAGNTSGYFFASITPPANTTPSSALITYVPEPAALGTLALAALALGRRRRPATL